MNLANKPILCNAPVENFVAYTIVYVSTFWEEEHPINKITIQVSTHFGIAKKES